MIPQDFIHQLLDRTDIVEVVDHHVPLKKKGANYQACCPFHSEKTPSFTVSPSKQFYHCFGCGAHGTAISFLMEYAGMDFPEAVKDLAGRVGLTVPDDGQARRPEDGRRDELLQVMEDASEYYRDVLKTSEKAVTYLKARGLTGDTAARFALGYAPEDWQGLAKGVANYQSTALEEAGLVIVGDGKRYDRFRDRVMFPIRNERGRTIAFGGRVLGSGEPKYLNSPETPLFHKGRELYGLHENRRAIQKSGLALVVEGYMDVVMLAQHSVDNAVATLGTAVTADQVAKIFRLVDRVIFAFDGDAAGRKAAWRALENSLPQLPDGKQAAFLFLPEGEDPDSFVRSQGADVFRQLCDQAKPLSEFLFESLQAQTDMTSQEGRVRLVKLMEPLLNQLRNAPLLARALRSKLSQMSGLSSPQSSQSRRSGPVRGSNTKQRREMLGTPQRVVIQAVLAQPSRAAELTILPPATNKDGVALDLLLKYIQQHPDVDQARDLVEALRGQEGGEIVAAAAASILLWEKDAQEEEDYRGAKATLQEQSAQAELERLNRTPLAQMSPEDRQRLVEVLKFKKLDQINKNKGE